MDQAEADQKRTELLEARGYRVLRFWNSDVLSNTDGVLEEILNVIGRPSPNSLSLVRERELGVTKRKDQNVRERRPECSAEIHWYEAHGIGRKELEIKRVL